PGVAQGAVPGVVRTAAADVPADRGQHLAAGADPPGPRPAVAEPGRTTAFDTGMRGALAAMGPRPAPAAGPGAGPPGPGLDRPPGPADGPGLHPVAAGAVSLRRPLHPLARGLLHGQHRGGHPAVHDARAPG